jgi:hypothetical protein
MSEANDLNTLLCFVVLAISTLGLIGYLAGCAGAQRWLSFKEWW